MSPEELEAFLTRTFNTLQQMQRAEEEGRPMLQKGADAEESEKDENLEGGDPLAAFRLEPLSCVQEDRIVCLECGAEFRQLTANHLRTHGLTPREFKRKWGFPLKQPLAAKALTRARSRSAKKRGLPVELQDFQERRRNERRKAAAKNESDHS
jgi:predicted transcriptional regulator